LYNLVSLEQNKADALKASQAVLKNSTDIQQKAGRLKNKNILLVEDNALNVEVATTLLQQVGITVDVAYSGSEALTMTKIHDYDAILMDLHMPEMDGFTTTHYLRERHSTQTTPIIALSAAVMSEDIDEAKAAGMNDHLGKPFDVEQLIDVLLRWTTDGVAEVTRSPSAPQAQPAPTIADPAIAPELSALLAKMGCEGSELIRRFQGNSRIILTLLRNFAANHPEWPAQLRAAQHSAPQLEPLLHTIKGTTGTMGLTELFVLAEQAERQLLANTLPDIEPLASLLQQTIAAITDEPT
jgi:CheY-like chemotaxis protein